MWEKNLAYIPIGKILHNCEGLCKILKFFTQNLFPNQKFVIFHKKFDFFVKNFQISCTKISTRCFLWENNMIPAQFSIFFHKENFCEKKVKFPAQKFSLHFFVKNIWDSCTIFFTFSQKGIFFVRNVTFSCEFHKELRPFSVKEIFAKFTKNLCEKWEIFLWISQRIAAIICAWKFPSQWTNFFQ